MIRYIFLVKFSLNTENMKTLKNHIVLFDAECPMCKAYTKGFVASGMLQAGGRAAYQERMEDICPLIDRQRAVNEIALVNTDTGEVTYGISSLFKIIGNAFPFFNPVFACRPFTWLMRKFYAFVSYNRRVIIPAGIGEARFTWQPAFRLHYRVAYLAFTWLCTGFILTGYTHLLKGLLPPGGAYREYWICGGQMLFQAGVISFYARKKLWDYLGNVMTISFAGALLLLALVLASRWLHVGAYLAACYFMLVVSLMLLEHLRRSKLLGLGYTMTISWIMYRILVLAVMLK